jgi:hypothetical protein
MKIPHFQIWAKFESNMGFGLKVQRHNYLAHCVTPAEMALLREQFSRLVGTKGEGPGIGPLAREIGTNGAIVCGKMEIRLKMRNMNLLKEHN